MIPFLVELCLRLLYLSRMLTAPCSVGVLCVLTWADVISASGGRRVVRPPAAKTQALGSVAGILERGNRWSDLP